MAKKYKGPQYKGVRAKNVRRGDFIRFDLYSESGWYIVKSVTSIIRDADKQRMTVIHAGQGGRNVLYPFQWVLVKR